MRETGCRGSCRRRPYIRYIIILFVLALFISIVPAQLAQAYVVNFGHFSPPTGYWATSINFPASWVTPAINAGNAWTNVTNCDFSYVRNQTLGALYSNYLSNSNWGDAELALTGYSVDCMDDNAIYDMDIRMNTYFTWSTSGAPTAYDVQNCLTHEFGHGTPLGHTSYTAATMYRYSYPGETKKRSLYFDDIDGLRAIY